MKKIIIIFILFTTLMWSQQDAQYTQYMYNMSVINPAYTTGDLGIINIGALHRTQWVGVEGAPKSSNIFAHTPLSENVEAGFSMVNDNIGDVIKENNFYADFAYKLNLGYYGHISFGLKAGLTVFDVNFNDFNLESGSAFTDTEFTDNIHQSFFNFGAGVYYNTDQYYVGFSIPNILTSNHLNKENGKYQSIKDIHMFLTGGYVFIINEQFKFKPAFMAKGVNTTNITLDLTSNVIYKNIVEFGLSYRLSDSVGAMVNFNLNDTLRVGYAYDYTVSNIGPFSSGSHELLILYNIKLFNNYNGFDKSPRFF